MRSFFHKGGEIMHGVVSGGRAFAIGKAEIAAIVAPAQRVEWTGENEMTITTDAHNGQPEKVEVVDMSTWPRPLGENDPVLESITRKYQKD